MNNERNRTESLLSLRQKHTRLTGILQERNALYTYNPVTNTIFGKIGKGNVCEGHSEAADIKIGRTRVKVARSQKRYREKIENIELQLRELISLNHHLPEELTEESSQDRFAEMRTLVNFGYVNQHILHRYETEAVLAEVEEEETGGTEKKNEDFADQQTQAALAKKHRVASQSPELLALAHAHQQEIQKFETQLTRLKNLKNQGTNVQFLLHDIQQELELLRSRPESNPELAKGLLLLRQNEQETQQ
jgi:hypothetical protein